MTTIRNVLQQAVIQLKPFSDTAQIDAACLLAFVLKKTRAYLFTYPELTLTDQQRRDYQALIAQRQTGWPIAYLIGERAFWTLNLAVSTATLIPRPETEMLVERALNHIATIAHVQLLELGTGSGAIALALASERPDCQITAVDMSPDALRLAEVNAGRLPLSIARQVTFLQSDWFTALSADALFHLIIANPPYLATDDPHLLAGDLRYEPRQALVSEDKGLAAIKHIIHQAPHYLHPNGWLCIEHGATQKEAVQTLFMQAGFHSIKTHLDIQGHPRLTEGQRHKL